MAVPNGTYRVRAVCGDAEGSYAYQALDIEGVPAILGQSDFSNPFVEGTFTVEVRDGYLTVQNLADYSYDTSICFLDIEEVPATLNINFQPTLAPAVAGYAIDDGGVFSAQMSSPAYGWLDANPTAIDRNSETSPDQRYDTSVALPDGAVWEIELPSGLYDVRVVCGDPSATSGVYRVEVEGVTLVDGTASATQRFVEGAQTISVTDGRLTLRGLPGSVGNRLCFLEIVRTVVPIERVPTSAN
jgi:hypothetical protein